MFFKFFGIGLPPVLQIDTCIIIVFISSIIVIYMNTIKYHFVAKFVCINTIYADNLFIRSVRSMHILTNKMLIQCFLFISFFFFYTLYFSF